MAASREAELLFVELGLGEQPAKPPQPQSWKPNLPYPPVGNALSPPSIPDQPQPWMTKPGAGFPPPFSQPPMAGIAPSHPQHGGWSGAETDVQAGGDSQPTIPTDLDAVAEAEAKAQATKAIESVKDAPTLTSKEIDDFEALHGPLWPRLVSLASEEQKETEKPKEIPQAPWPESDTGRAFQIGGNLAEGAGPPLNHSQLLDLQATQVRLQQRMTQIHNVAMALRHKRQKEDAAKAAADLRAAQLRRRKAHEEETDIGRKEKDSGKDKRYAHQNKVVADFLSKIKPSDKPSWIHKAALLDEQPPPWPPNLELFRLYTKMGKLDVEGRAAMGQELAKKRDRGEAISQAEKKMMALLGVSEPKPAPAAMPQVPQGTPYYAAYGYGTGYTGGAVPAAPPMGGVGQYQSYASAWK